MSITKSIIPEKYFFPAKMIRYKERDTSSADNFPNFTHPLDSNIEFGKDAFIFKEATSQYDRLFLKG